MGQVVNIADVVALRRMIEDTESARVELTPEALRQLKVDEERKQIIQQALNKRFYGPPRGEK